MAPCGASAGRHEVVALRDGGARYGGLGVATAINNIHRHIAPAIAGLDATDQEALDAALLALDGTDELSRLGGNAILAVSLAVARAAAEHHGVALYRLLIGDAPPLLPLPMVNMVSGGAHADGAIDVQDVLAIALRADSFAAALEILWRVRRAASQVASGRGMPGKLVADEGGLGVALTSNDDALSLLCEATQRAGLAPGVDVAFAIDVAASGLLRDGAYQLTTDRRTLAPAQWIAELEDWCERFPIASLEDPLHEDEWGDWQRATVVLGERIQLVGDDLFATNETRVRRAVEQGVANAVLIKPNQCGTLTAARRALEAARAGGYATIVSARSGDTEEPWLADLAVGWRAGQIKVGSLMRSERTAKWNRLLRIEAQCTDAVYAGAGALARPAST
jgi:enolase